MEFSQLKAETRRLREVLSIDGDAIAIAYSNEKAEGTQKEKVRVCGALPEARDGAIITLSAESCACPGGVSHLGLGESRPGLEAFLVHGEKLWCSLATARRARQIRDKKAAPPVSLAKYVLFSPMEKCEFEPDLVVFICNPTQASRLIALYGFLEGAVPSCELGGSMCWSSITYPLMSGNFNVTMGDYSARRMEKWKADELIVSVPKNKMETILSSIDHCIAGTAEPSEAFKRLLEKIERGEEISPEEIGKIA